jgi:hypothetical protein
LGLLTRILGGKDAKAETVDDAQAALARLADERKQAKAEISELAEKRRALLLVDDSDKEIALIEKTSAAAELRLERLDEAEPNLLAALTAARNRKRQAEWAAVRDTYFPAASRYLAAMREARQAFDALTGVINEAQSRGFSSEAAHLFAFPTHVLDVEALNRFDVAVERAEAASHAPPKPPVAPVPTSPAVQERARPQVATVEILAPEGVKTFGGARQGQIKRGVPADVAWGWVRSGVAKFVGAPPPEPGGAVAPSPPKLPPLAPKSPPVAARAAAPAFVAPTPDADGNVAIVVLRGGLPMNGQKARVGKVELVPQAQAIELLRRGAVDLATAEQAAKAKAAAAGAAGPPASAEASK